MSIGEKLQKLIVEKQTNVNELSIKAKVSPQTIYSIIKRNSTKADIDVLIRISKILGVPVEYFGDNELLAVISLNLTEDEIAHIKKYRQLDANGIIAVDNYIDFLLAQAADNAKKIELRLG